MLQNCRFVKTVLMILVIFGHSAAFWSGTWFTENPAIPSEGLNYLYGWINSFHIFAFTLVSGYIYTSKRIGGGITNFLLSYIIRQKGYLCRMFLL